MKRVSLLIFLVFSLLACQVQPDKVTVATSSPEPSKFELGKMLLEQQDFEGAAVALREVLDEFDAQNVPLDRQGATQELCTKALVEAGGFVGSMRLWQGLKDKNPDSAAEASRMIARAKKMMLLQADELLLQAKEDLEGGTKSKALSAVRAALQLYEEAQGPEESVSSAKELETKILTEKTKT